MSDYQGNPEPEDYDNPRNYCRHGTFIGDPYGADLMCYWCETGEEPGEANPESDQADI